MALASDEAAVRINALIDKFKKEEIRQFDEFTAILCTWRNEIPNSFIRPYGDRNLSNSFTENINGRIKTYLAVSNGIAAFKDSGSVLSSLCPRTSTMR